MSKVCCTVALTVTLFGFSNAQAASVVSTFDVDADGWAGWPGEGAVAHVAAGGNPDGHIRVTDIGIGGPLGSAAVAPSKFLGDLSGFNNGALSVDLSTFGGGGGLFDIFGTWRIESGSGQVALFDTTDVTPPRGAWTTVLAPMTAEAWGTTPGEWSAILADVTSLAISTDAFDGGDTIGIDNVSLRPVPLPAAAPMLFGALVLLGRFARRRLEPYRGQIE